jgi:hypothetical protein
MPPFLAIVMAAALLSIIIVVISVPLFSLLLDLFVLTIVLAVVASHGENRNE